jgi:hypothetical protein
MASNLTTHPLKILVNIEQFGFGTVASITEFFSSLQNRFAYVAYIGDNLNLPPQSRCNFDAVFDEKEFEKVVTDFDLFFTASHFSMAEIANTKGVPTAIYDPLCWYRPQIPDILRQDVLYIAQAFYGVKERIAAEKFFFPFIVKPVPLKPSVHQEKNLVLLNLSGIQNPFWSIEICKAYAETMIFSFKKAISPKERFIILCDPLIAERIPETKSLHKEEMTTLLARVKFVVQTPALGNILDAAVNGIPNVLLPPITDFQGQQLRLLQKHRQIDASIDWEDISPGLRVDYKENQKEVFGGIARNIIKLCATYYREKLENIFRKTIDTVAGKKRSGTNLLDQFECEGIDEGVKHLAAFASLRSLN